MKTFCIEVNKEQPEWKVIQVLVQLGFQKACWNDDIQADYIGVYLWLKCFFKIFCKDGER